MHGPWGLAALMDIFLRHARAGPRASPGRVAVLDTRCMCARCCLGLGSCEGYVRSSCMGWGRGLGDVNVVCAINQLSIVGHGLFHYGRRCNLIAVLLAQRGSSERPGKAAD